MNVKAYVAVAVAATVSTSTAHWSTIISLWWSKVFAWCRSAWTSAASFFDAQGAAFVDLTLKSLLRSVRLFSSDHLHEAKATALAGMWVAHDVALFDLSVFLEETGHLFFGQFRVNAGDEEIRARIDGLFVVVVSVRLMATAQKNQYCKF